MSEKMGGFEGQLRAIVCYAQANIADRAFVMYQSEYITVAHFDDEGELQVLADTRHTGDNTRTFGHLYAQLNEKIRLTAKRAA